MKTPYTVITCQGINGRFVCPEQPLFCNARIPWQGLGKLQDSGFLFGVDMVKEIQLTRGMVALVDDEDYERLSQLSWYASKNGSGKFYAKTWKTNSGRTIRMHREITNAPNGMDVDHINGNSLDNRRANLRICSRSQNNRNSGIRIHNKSGYKGVYFRKGGYKSSIHIDDKTIHLGTFRTAEEAARIYDEKAKELFGEFALLNFPNAAAPTPTDDVPIPQMTSKAGDIINEYAQQITRRILELTNFAQQWPIVANGLRKAKRGGLDDAPTPAQGGRVWDE